MQLRARESDGAQIDRRLLATEAGDPAAASFILHDMTLTADGVQVDYQNHEGKPVRIHFRISPSGRILHTSCGPLVRCTV
jgi:hypothetical protein